MSEIIDPLKTDGPSGEEPQTHIIDMNFFIDALQESGDETLADLATTYYGIASDAQGNGIQYDGFLDILETDYASLLSNNEASNDLKRQLEVVVAQLDTARMMYEADKERHFTELLDMYNGIELASGHLIIERDESRATVIGFEIAFDTSSRKPGKRQSIPRLVALTPDGRHMLDGRYSFAVDYTLLPTKMHEVVGRYVTENEL